MKKIFTLLAVAIVAVSAYAVAPKTFKMADVTMKLKPEFAAQFEADRAQINNEKVWHRECAPKKIVSSDGNEWTLNMFRYYLPWCDMLDFVNNTTGETVNYTFNELPGYCYRFYIYNTRNGKMYDMVWYDLFWPVICWGDEDCMTPDGEYDWEKATAKFGTLEAAQQPITIDRLLEVYGGPAKLVCMPWGAVPYCGIMSPGMTGNWSMYHGTQYGLITGYIENKTQILTNASYLQFNDYDEADNYLNFNLYAGFGTYDDNLKNVSTVRYRINEEFDGTDGNIRGFGPQDFKVGELHMFNLGELTPESDFALEFLDDVEPCQMYYMALCGPNFTFTNAYDKTTLPTDVYRTDEALKEDNDYSYVVGKLYGQPKAENPYGIYKMENYELNAGKLITNAAKPGVCFSGLIPNGSDKSVEAFVQKVSIGLTMAGYPSFFFPDDTSFGFGDKNKGFNAQWIDYMGGNVVLANYTGDIIYHSNPNDYTVIEKIPAVGTIDANVQTVSSGVAAIESDAPVVRVEYYNFQGIRLAEAPQHGMYIMREVKADGTVKATKLAK